MGAAGSSGVEPPGANPGGFSISTQSSILDLEDAIAEEIRLFIVPAIARVGSVAAKPLYHAFRGSGRERTIYCEGGDSRGADGPRMQDAIKQKGESMGRKILYAAPLIFLAISLASCAWAGSGADGAGPNDPIEERPFIPTSPKANRPCGINLAGVFDWTTEFPFKDFVKIARPWNGGDYTGLVLDENGWVRSIDPAVGRAVLLWDNPDSFAGEEFVCLYEGRGQVSVNPWVGMEEIPGTRTQGRFEFRMVDGRSPGIWTIEVSDVDPVDYVRNIRVVKRGHEATYLSDPWNPEFVSTIVDQFSTLRFMDWQCTNNSTTTSWSQRKTADYYTQSGTTGEKSASTALEYLVDLCNRTESDGWFCIPHLADEDYVRRFAEYIRDNMDEGLRVYIEYSNECWNWQFEQCNYCHDQGVALNLDADEWTAWRAFYALKSVQMFHIFESVFAGQQGRLVRVLASQGAWYDVTGRMLNYAVDGERAALHADALAIAPYFGVGANGQDLPNADALLAHMDRDVNQDSWENGDHTTHRSMEENYSQFITENPNLVMIAYEGGQHLVPLTQTAPDVWTYDPAKDALYYAVQTNTRMGTLYTQYLDHWRASGGQLFMLFDSVGNWGQYGYWGLRLTLDESSPKYDAVMTWMDANPTWW